MENVNKKFTLVGTTDSHDMELISKPALTFWQDAWRRFKKNRIAVVAMVVVIATLLFSLISIVLVPQSSANNFDPNKVQVYKNLPPKLGNMNIPGWNGEFTTPGNSVSTNVYEDQKVPSGTSYILGTDNLGRSLAKRTIVGLRISLLIAFAAILFDIFIGITYGLISGWVGGKVDNVMQRIIEIISSIPYLVIVTMLGMLLGQGVTSIILAIGMFIWTGIARQVRNLTLSWKEREFILASRTLGESTFRILIRHLLPNMLGVIIVQIMFDIPSVIFAEATLSAINLGVKPPTSSLGSLISDGISSLQFYPFQLAVPAVVLCLLSLSFFLFGYGLRDAFDPKSSED
ncbi:ABC transporter permease [Lactococcus sp.]|uniref:ABC transporter permease n=1 Tax=Lactococcus sp. TaxID=44273 RepID=UPI0035B26FEE